MAKEKEKEKENGEQTNELPPKKKASLIKIILIALIVLVLLGGGIGAAVYFLGHKKDTKKTEAKETKPAIGALWPMEPFIVNLADNQGERYLKVVMQLELSDPALTAELDQLKPKLRDNILDLLTAKTFAELMDTGGKQKLRDEVAMRLNAFLTKGKIVRVYFTEFVIQ